MGGQQRPYMKSPLDYDIPVVCTKPRAVRVRKPIWMSRLLPDHAALRLVLRAIEAVPEFVEAAARLVKRSSSRDCRRQLTVVDDRERRCQSSARQQGFRPHASAVVDPATTAGEGTGLEKYQSRFKVGYISTAKD